jgi:hypothetical protein
MIKPAILKHPDDLLFLTGKWVLELIPVLFVIGHVAADEVIYNYTTRHTFDFVYHNLSSYAWRSPAGWRLWRACWVSPLCWDSSRGTR